MKLQMCSRLSSEKTTWQKNDEKKHDEFLTLKEYIYLRITDNISNVILQIIKNKMAYFLIADSITLTLLIALIVIFAYYV